MARLAAWASVERKLIREHVPGLSLGGWANPHSDAATQVGYMADGEFHGEYYLPQVVSHHDMPRIDAFLRERDRRRVTLPGIFGVFFYRSANPRTLRTLEQFLPVPSEGLTRESAKGPRRARMRANHPALKEAGGRHSTCRTCLWDAPGRRSSGFWRGGRHVSPDASSFQRFPPAP